MIVVRRIVTAGTPLLIFAGAVGVVALIVTVAGYNAFDAAHAAAQGAFGSTFAIVSATLKRATPILMLGLAVAVAFRSGVLNIGAEGQFLAGAASACALGLAAGPGARPGIVVAELCVGLVVGGCWAGVAAWLKRRFGIMEVVSTLLLNFVALNLVGYLVRGPLQEPTGAYPQSAVLDPVARLPLLFNGQRLHAGFVLALGAALVAWWGFRSTAAGFRIRITGAGRHAAATAGLVDVNRVQAWALVGSGALAGLAGACEVTGVTYALYEGLSPGYGYTAIAVALLGGLNPIGIIVASVLFGALGAGADAMQRDAGVPAEFASIAAALAILGVLAVPAVPRLRAAFTERRAR